MRLFSQLACVAIIVCLANAAIAQERRAAEDRAAVFQRALAKGAGVVHEKQSAGRLVSVEVVIADVVADAGDKEMTAEKLAELDKAGKVTALSRLRLSALENEKALVQFGERVPIVTGRTSFSGGRGAQEAVSLENMGTMISMKARVDSDDSVVIELQAEQTRLAPAAAKAEGDDASAPGPPRSLTITSQTTVRVPPGKTVVAGGKATRTDKGTVQTWILVSASAEAGKANAADNTSAIKVFSLKNAQADSLATIIQNVFRASDIQIGVDARTNSLIVQGDPQQLDVVQRLVVNLDEPQAAPQK